MKTPSMRIIEEDVWTTSRRIMGASLPPLKDIHHGTVGGKGRSAMTKLTRSGLLLQTLKA